MTIRRYDAIVIGGRLSAAITAALLAKRGMRGILIDQGELATADGKLLPDVVMSDHGSLTMELVHSELGMREVLKARVRPVAPALQAIFADARLDLFGSREPLLAEAARALGPAGAGLAAFLGRVDRLEAQAGSFLASAGVLPPTGFFGRRRVATQARKHAQIGTSVEASGILDGLSPELRDLALAPLPFLTHLDAKRPSEISLARLVRPLGRFLRGISHIEDGRSLRELFLDLARRKGFEVRRTVVELIEPKGKTWSLRLATHKDDLVTTDVLVDCSADLSGLVAIPHRQKSKSLSLMLEAARPRGALHAVAIEVDRAVIPPGMAEYVLLLDRRRDPARFDSEDPDAEDRPILLVVKPVPGSDQRVQLVASCPVSLAGAQARSIDRLDAAIRARIERLIPFLSEGAPELHALEPRSALKGRRPLLPHPLFEPALDPISGLAGIPMRTSFSNIFVAGPAVLPGLGIEGEYLSALQAADACEHLGTGVKRPKRLEARGPSSAGL